MSLGAGEPSLPRLANFGAIRHRIDGVVGELTSTIAAISVKVGIYRRGAGDYFPDLASILWRRWSGTESRHAGPDPWWKSNRHLVFPQGIS
jgi:hypothetical protein